MTTELAVRVEDKLFYNRYLVDAGRAHIKVRPHTVASPALLTLLKACPARCYELNDKGQVEEEFKRRGGAVGFVRIPANHAPKVVMQSDGFGGMGRHRVSNLSGWRRLATESLL